MQGGSEGSASAFSYRGMPKIDTQKSNPDETLTIFSKNTTYYTNLLIPDARVRISQKLWSKCVKTPSSIIFTISLLAAFPNYYISIFSPAFQLMR